MTGDKDSNLLKRLYHDEAGSAITEYAVCLALLVLATILAILSLGSEVSELFPDLAEVV